MYQESPEVHLPNFRKSLARIFSFCSISKGSLRLDFDTVWHDKILEVYATKVLEYIVLLVDVEMWLWVDGMEASHICIFLKVHTSLPYFLYGSKFFQGYKYWILLIFFIEI